MFKELIEVGGGAVMKFINCAVHVMFDFSQTHVMMTMTTNDDGGDNGGRPIISYKI